MFMDWKVQHRLGVSVPQIDIKFNMIPIKISQSLFSYEIDKWF